MYIYYTCVLYTIYMLCFGGFAIAAAAAAAAAADTKTNTN